ncbi:MAG: hypothetical protein J5722_07610 [Oscillospiraceae bacterium]|nr:hypothetical protein [Oscillospiraceae bacterium]
MKRIRIFVLLSAVLAGFTICPAAFADTSAEESAAASAGEPTGDLNGDGTADRSDLLLLRDALCTKDAEFDPKQADLYADELLDARDLTMLKRLIPVTDTPPQETEWILEPKGTVHSGFATFYGGGYEGGCAMLDPVSRDYWITAMNLPDWNNAELAGAYLEVTGELGTIKVLVTDLLPEGAKGDLDLYTDAFPLIAPAEKGKVPVTWRIIPLDTAETAPLSYKYKVGSTEFWCAVQVRNHRYPIEKLEYLNEDGSFVELPRRNFNYFEAQSGLGKGPFTFRITDIYGQVVIDEDIPFTPDEIQQGHAQFPE